MYTLGTAAKAVGKSKSVISRDIASGKISATKNANGGYAIDPAELHRVYPAKGSGNGTKNTDWNDSQPPESSIGTVPLRAELEFLHEQMAAFNIERERERRQLTDQIDDLRRRLDRADEQREGAQTKLTAILTDQRPKPEAQESAKAEPQDPHAGRGFWGLFGRRRTA